MPVAGGPKITKTGILLDVDAADTTSYPGSGTTWTNNARVGDNNGTLNNISFDPADSKGALIFTGSNTYVDFGNLGPSLTSSFSFQVAFKPAATASGQPYTILSYASASATSSITFKLDYTSSNQTVVLSTFSTGSGAARTVHAISASVASGSWNIVHGTFGTSLAALYVNGLGQVYQPTTGSSVGYNASNQLYAGGTYGSDSGFYTGSMANVTVNNADLDGLTVNKNYNAIATRFSLPVRKSPITDADAFNFVEIAGIQDETQQSAINTLVLALKANDIWNQMVAVYPLVGGNATAHSLNLINPNTKQIIWSGGVDHTTSPGVTFDGVNGYGNTQVSVNDLDATGETEGSIGAYVGSNSGGSITGLYVYTGIYDGNSYVSFALGKRPSLYVSTPPGLTWPSSTGFIGTSRNTGYNYYFFNSNLTDSTFTTGRMGNGYPYNIGRANGSPINYQTSYFNGNLRFMFFGKGITKSQTQAFYTAVQAFQITLGRQA